MNREKGRGNPTASRTWPTALAMVFVALLVWYMVYTVAIVRSRDADVEITARIYAAVQEGLASREVGAELKRYLRNKDNNAILYPRERSGAGSG